MTSRRPPDHDVFRLVGAVLERKIRVERVVARGGFGVVYAGHHLALDVPVAVKVLREHHPAGGSAPGAFLERFQHEARAMARLRHPNIVQVLDTGVSVMPAGERAAWIVLEWLKGWTLDEELGAVVEPRSPRAALALVRPVFEALSYAHDEGIAHRDVKPANIMRAAGRRGSALKVLDFGIAKFMADDAAAGSGLTATGAGLRAFSPLYAAPEQVSGTRTGPWTDVHALGLLFTQAVLGERAYRHRETARLYQEILSPDRPTPARNGVPLGPLDAVLERALAFAPEDRYADARAFLAALDATLAAMPDADATPRVTAVRAPLERAPARDAPAVSQTCDLVRDDAAPEAPARETTPLRVISRPRPEEPLGPGERAREGSLAVAETSAAPSARRRRVGALSAALVLVAGITAGVFAWPRARGPARSAPVAVVASPPRVTVEAPVEAAVAPPADLPAPAPAPAAPPVALRSGPRPSARPPRSARAVQVRGGPAYTLE